MPVGLNPRNIQILEKYNFQHLADNLYGRLNVIENMKIIRTTFLFIVLFIPGWIYSQSTASIVSFDQLQGRITDSRKELTVVNFWATWCAPCIKELPYFEAAFKENADRMDLILVNLDFADKIDKVNTFINKKALTGEVLLLDNIDYNSWIDKVDPSWSGAIPATLFINARTGERKLVEGEMSEGELSTHLNEMIN